MKEFIKSVLFLCATVCFVLWLVWSIEAKAQVTVPAIGGPTVTYMTPAPQVNVVPVARRSQQVYIPRPQWQYPQWLNQALTPQYLPVRPNVEMNIDYKNNTGTLCIEGVCEVLHGVCDDAYIPECHK